VERQNPIDLASTVAGGQRRALGAGLAVENFGAYARDRFGFEADEQIFLIALVRLPLYLKERNKTVS
jgi:hypothetical protein